MKKLNLDAFVCEDAEIELNGEKYYIPGEVSVDYIFALEHAFQKCQSEGASVEEWNNWLELFYDLFTRKNNMPDFDKFKRMFNARQVGALHGFVISALSSPEYDTKELKDDQKKTILEALEGQEIEQISE